MRIICTYEDYDRLENIFEKMYFRAEDYVPTDKEIDDIILPNLEEYVKFLLWVDITGINTDKNFETRKRIRKLLSQKIELVDELPDTEDDV